MNSIIRKALLVDIYDAPQEIKDSFMNIVELNGNPFYHRWYICRGHWDETMKEQFTIVDSWLKLQGLTSEDIVIVTGGW